MYLGKLHNTDVSKHSSFAIDCILYLQALKRAKCQYGLLSFIYSGL